MNTIQEAPSAATESISITARHVLFACPDFRIGGHSTHTLNFAKALRRHGCRAGALVPEPFGDLYDDFVESLDYISVIRRGAETRGGYLQRLAKRIADLRPEVLINNAVPSVQAALPLLPPNICRISVVHNVTNYEVALGLAHGPWLDWAVGVSDNIRHSLDSENRDGVNLATIPVGIEPQRQARQQEKAAVPLRLIYVGRMEPQKNLAGLLRVLTRLHGAGVPFIMTMVGGGAEFNTLQAQAQAAPYRNQIRFTGVQSQRQVASLLDQHDFLLMTSHYEGTPHAILEAMAHGLIVVASRLPGATDRIISDTHDGYLCDRNRPEEYVSVLGRYVEKPAEFGTVSRAAIHTALARYGADGFAVQLASLFARAREDRPEIKPLNRIIVPAALRPHFPGFALQCKHRIADLWRRIAAGERPRRAKVPVEGTP
jgi:glycosyltransferase involved in cell wall biosynthesis